MECVLLSLYLNFGYSFFSFVVDVVAGFSADVFNSFVLVSVKVHLTKFWAVWPFVNHPNNIERAEVFYSGFVCDKRRWMSENYPRKEHKHPMNWNFYCVLRSLHNVHISRFHSSSHIVWLCGCRHLNLPLLRQIASTTCTHQAKLLRMKMCHHIATHTINTSKRTRKKSRRTKWEETWKRTTKRKTNMKKRTLFINCVQFIVHYIVCMFANTKPIIINHHLTHTHTHRQTTRGRREGERLRRQHTNTQNECHETKQTYGDWIEMYDENNEQDTHTASHVYENRQWNRPENRRLMALRRKYPTLYTIAYAFDKEQN